MRKNGMEASDCGIRCGLPEANAEGWRADCTMCSFKSKIGTWLHAMMTARTHCVAVQHRVDLK